MVHDSRHAGACLGVYLCASVFVLMCMFMWLRLGPYGLLGRFAARVFVHVRVCGHVCVDAHVSPLVCALSYSWTLRQIAPLLQLVFPVLMTTAPQAVLWQLSYAVVRYRQNQPCSRPAATSRAVDLPQSAVQLPWRN